MIAAPRAVLVEVLRPYLVVAQIVTGRALFLDRTGRRDVVGGDRVEEQAEDARIDDVLDRLLLLAHAGEVRRVLHIGRTVVPRVSEPALHGDLAPVRLALEYVGVFLREHVLVDGLADDRRDLLAGRPDVTQIDFLAVLVGAERRLGDIDLHRAGERIGNHERRRGEIVRPDVGIDAALEVAIARQHG